MNIYNIYIYEQKYEAQIIHKYLIRFHWKFIFIKVSLLIPMHPGK